MRSADVAKCWPFSEKAVAMKNSEEVEALLPPITVAKFKWWSHELRRLRSTRPRDEKLTDSLDEKSEIVCPVCRVFAATTVNAVNAHIDDCLSGQSAPKEEHRQILRSSKAIKPKSKPTKKRSITEIFAVAPQIETIESSEVSEQEDEDLEEELLVDDFKVMLSVSRGSSSTGGDGSIVKVKKKNMSKKRKKEKEKKKVLMEKLKENNKKLKKKKKVMKKMKNVGGSNSLVTKVCDLYHKISVFHSFLFLC